SVTVGTSEGVGNSRRGSKRHHGGWHWVRTYGVLRAIEIAYGDVENIAVAACDRAGGGIGAGVGERGAGRGSNIHWRGGGERGGGRGVAGGDGHAGPGTAVVAVVGFGVSAVRRSRALIPYRFVCAGADIEGPRRTCRIGIGNIFLGVAGSKCGSCGRVR